MMTGDSWMCGNHYGNRAVQPKEISLDGLVEKARLLKEFKYQILIHCSSEKFGLLNSCQKSHFAY